MQNSSKRELKGKKLKNMLNLPHMGSESSKDIDTSLKRNQNSFNLSTKTIIPRNIIIDPLEVDLNVADCISLDEEPIHNRFNLDQTESNYAQGANIEKRVCGVVEVTDYKAFFINCFNCSEIFHINDFENFMRHIEADHLQPEKKFDEIVIKEECLDTSCSTFDTNYCSKEPEPEPEPELEPEAEIEPEPDIKIHVIKSLSTTTKNTNEPKLADAARKSYVCPTCNKVFYTKNNFRDHVSRHNPQFPCTLCPKAFNKNYWLQQHLKLHRNERDIICEFCAKTFTSKKLLINHISTVHRGLNFKCNICGLEFKGLKSNLVRHQKATHLPLEGTIEDLKDPKRKFRLRTLNRRYDNPRKFNCSECKIPFTSLKFLKDHNKQQHSNRIKRFACDLCGLRFQNKANLNRHKHNVKCVKKNDGDSGVESGGRDTGKKK